MLIIRHRVNTIEELKETPKEYGVEIDIRASGKELLLSHNPINESEKYDNLKDFLKQFNHAFIIFNIKETGIENEVISLARENNIENYFLLDVEFPYLYRATRRNSLRKIAVRFSEAEPLEMALAQKGLLDWVWVDTNTLLPLNPDNFKILKQAGLKICLVCPELWGRPEDIEKYISYMKENNINIDAVMTSLKYTKEWETLN